MELLTERDIPPADKSELEFRRSHWGALAAHLFFLSGLIIALDLFAATFIIPGIKGFHWSRIVLVLIFLMMWGISRITYRLYTALRRPGNWLARIGPGGLLVKYRSYLHNDLPAEDPIAVRLEWYEIEQVQLQKEVFHGQSLGEKTEVRRWFLNIKLKHHDGDVEKLKEALAFEHQRKPVGFRIAELKHELFLARKNRAPDSEITRIKMAIQDEKRRYPGWQSKGRFLHRPVTFVEPDLLKLEWTPATPGAKILREWLARYINYVRGEDQNLHADKPMSNEEFSQLLASLVSRDEQIEAMKLVRRHLGYDLAEAKTFIEKTRPDFKP